MDDNELKKIKYEANIDGFHQALNCVSTLLRDIEDGREPGVNSSIVVGNDKYQNIKRRILALKK